MWSPTTNSTAASDNNNKQRKKSETAAESEDCSCSADTQVEPTSAKQPQQQQQQGKEAIAEAIDSGFISGPQNSSYLEQDDEAEQTNNFKPNITTTQQQQQQKNITKKSKTEKQQQQEEQTILDSGCIDADFVEEEEAEAEQQAVTAAAAANQATTAQAEATVVAKQQSQQQTNKQAAVSSAKTQSANNNTNNNNKNNQPMILKENVDAGMLEWFCNLSLQTGAPARPSQGDFIAMNNLDARKTATAAAANSKTTATGAANLTPSNAWEQFYQQNDKGNTPMHLACLHGYDDVVAALIRMAPHPCLFNIKNDAAQTPLHLAALTAQPKILRMLLIAGAEPTMRDCHGNTALHLACITGEEQSVRALTIPISASEINEAHRQYGHRSNDNTQMSYLKCASLPSDLEITNYYGERCVHLAAQAGDIDILRILVLYGADINAREGRGGDTPLHMAIKNCNEDLVNFLLDECQKLNLETLTYARLTAYQLACALNRSQMQYMLEKRGAEPLSPPESDYDSSDSEDLDDSKIYDRFGDPSYFANYNGGNAMTVA